MLFSIAMRGQELGTVPSYRDIRAERYFRVDYVNDLPFGTDYYYTQGAHFELVSPFIGRLPTRYLFPRAPGDSRRYGIALESAGYTPTTIFADSILPGDRPFAGMAFIKAFMVSVDSSRRSRMATTMSLGWMGPAAGGYEIQSAIHRRTGNPDPIGWQYQVRDGLILNYEIDYERALSPAGRPWLLSGRAMARVGSLSTKAVLGLVCIAGLYDDPFTSGLPQRRFWAYAYIHPELELIGYDASLQGFFGSAGNPYVIKAADVRRLVFRARTGLVIGFGDLTAAIQLRYLSPEFSSGSAHWVGGLQLGFAF